MTADFKAVGPVEEAEGVESGSAGAGPAVGAALSESPRTPEGSQSAPETLCLEESPKPMLDVHAPHARIHTWKDFFVHIATITIGLLIAIGLEQSVEYVHHLSQLQTARRELAAELDENRAIARRNDAEMILVLAKLKQDMALLHTARDAHKPVAGKLNYSWLFARPRDGVWQSVKQNGTLDLMPHAELEKYVYVYNVFGSLMDALTVQNEQMDVAAGIALRAPDGAYSPRDLDDLIAATSDAQGKSTFAQRVLQFEEMGLREAP